MTEDGGWQCPLELQPPRICSARSHTLSFLQPQPKTLVTAKRGLESQDACPVGAFQGGFCSHWGISRGCRGASGCAIAGPGLFPIRGMESESLSPFLAPPASSSSSSTCLPFHRRCPEKHLFCSLPPSVCFLRDPTVLGM